MINFMNRLLNALEIGVADSQLDGSFEPVFMKALKDRHSHLVRMHILMVEDKKYKILARPCWKRRRLFSRP